MKTSHLSEQELDNYLSGQLNEISRLQHIQECRYCQQQAAAYQWVDQFMNMPQPEFSHEEASIWSEHVLVQIEQVKIRQEQRHYWALNLGCLTGWIGLIIGFGYLGIFGDLTTLWVIMVNSTGILLMGGVISLFISGFDWLEKHLYLDPYRMVLQQNSSVLNTL